MELEIKNYRSVQRGCVVGEFSVEFDGRRLSKMCHLRKGDREWVNFPVYKDDTGTAPSWQPYYEYVDPEKTKAFLRALYDKIQSMDLPTSSPAAPSSPSAVPF